MHDNNRGDFMKDKQKIICEGKVIEDEYGIRIKAGREEIYLTTKKYFEMLKKGDRWKITFELLKKGGR